MILFPLERLLDKSDFSIYKLVILAVKRANEIAEGQPKLAECDSITKPSSVALCEIADDKVRMKAGRRRKHT